MKKTLITPIAILAFLLFATGAAISAEPYDKEGAMFEKPQRLSEIMDNDVVNHQGQELGTIDDLVANEEGKLEYLILSRGGVMGVGGDLVAIPLDAVEPKITEEDQLSINVDEQTLEQAPSFAAGEYPDFADRQWQQEARGYFENGQRSPGQERSPGVMDQQERSPGVQQQPGGQQ